MALEKICGIYCIENKVNNKKYIGQSIDVRRRWRSHKNDLRHNKHRNIYLQSAWNKYGEDQFNFYLIEECEKELLDDKEEYWISFYKSISTEDGYNLTAGGNQYNYWSGLTKEECLQRVCKGEDTHLNILTTNDVMDIIKRFQNGDYDSDIARDYNVDKSAIAAIRHHKTWKHLTDGLDLGISNGQHLRLRPCVSVDMYDQNGMFIKSFDNMRIAAKEVHISHDLISSVCHGRKRTAAGYVWRFKGHPFNEFHTDNYNMRSVDQYDINWNFINSYNSIKDAIDNTGLSRNNIWRSLFTSKPVKNFYWVYHNSKTAKEDKDEKVS